MAAKHFIIYYQNGSGTYVITEPRPWARENQSFFPTYDFIKNHPNVETIENFLINNKNFQKVVNTEDFVVIQNLDPRFIF
jgi:hypothetical protein